jgi:hypothetical protein
LYGCKVYGNDEQHYKSYQDEDRIA